MPTMRPINSRDLKPPVNGANKVAIIMNEATMAEPPAKGMGLSWTPSSLGWSIAPAFMANFFYYMVLRNRIT